MKQNSTPQVKKMTLIMLILAIGLTGFSQNCARIVRTSLNEVTLNNYQLKIVGDAEGQKWIGVLIYCNGTLLRQQCFTLKGGPDSTTINYTCPGITTVVLTRNTGTCGHGTECGRQTVLPIRCNGCVGGVLAVKLNYFAAKKVNAQQAQLNWSTLTEENTKEFLIERSSDGLNFSELTRVTAKGNSAAEVKYNTIDNNPLAGTNFYRMTMLGLDGSKTFSDIVQVNMNNAKTSKLDIYPNPAQGQVTVNLSDLPLYSNTLSVMDMAGTRVINNQVVNGNSIKLNVDTIKAGTYIVKVTTADGITVQNKMMVVNNR